MVLQPKIIYHLAVIFTLVIVFYLLLPGIGAFRIRGIWRRFRSLLLKSALLPPLTYTDLRAAEGEAGRKGGAFRFFGYLQALKGDNTIWLTDGEVSLMAQLEQVYVYILTFNKPIAPDSWEHYPVHTPQRVKWEKISSLPEQTKLFVSGCLDYREGQPVFIDTPENPLFVLIYEGEDKETLLRGIWSGREKNEYWNSMTPGALLLGLFSLFIYFYILLQDPGTLFPAAAALTLACLPITPLLPPCIVSYYFYRKFWQSGRVLRAQRDLLRLPLAFFHEQEGAESSQSVRLYSGELYQMRIIRPEEIPLDNAIPRVIPSLRCCASSETLVCFGKEGAPLERPDDPMAEAMIVPGDPFALSHTCQKYAFRKEILGLFILFFGIGCTEFLLFFLFTYIVY